MPKIFDMTAVEWPEDEEDFWPKPKPSEFQYYTPHDFGGRAEPVRFSIATASLAGEELSDDELLEAQFKSLPPQHPGFFGWMRGLFGGGQGDNGRHTDFEFSDQMNDWRRQQAVQEAQRTRLLLDHALPLLTADLNAARLHGRYDGGNDEGFSWLDHIETTDGRTLSRDEVIAASMTSPRLQKLEAENLLRSTDGPDALKLELGTLIDIDICGVFAMWLLGRGYGTGEYSMYGAFKVDFEAETITDDPTPDPVVQNIDLSLDS
ncbi:MAG: hypothetical protein AAF732_19120 [Pseudomonadota bacterium]